MAMSPLFYLNDLRSAFVAHLADRLSDEICRESAKLSQAMGVIAPEKTHSAMLYLAKRGPATLAEIARSDGQSHQLLAARLAPLEKLKLIERFDDPADGRRRPYRLTKRGREDAAVIEAVSSDLAQVMDAFFRESGVNLITVLEDAIERLRRRPITERSALRKVEHA